MVKEKPNVASEVMMKNNKYKCAYLFMSDHDPYTGSILVIAGVDYRIDSVIDNTYPDAHKEIGEADPTQGETIEDAINRAREKAVQFVKDCEHKGWLNTAGLADSVMDEELFE